MPAYVIGNIHEHTPGTGGAEYLRRIDTTLAPFGGRFIVHGAAPEVLEGDWSGDTIIIEFPTIEDARGWYASEAYEEIKPYRTSQYEGAVLIIDGVPAGHRSTDLLGA